LGLMKFDVQIEHRTQISRGNGGRMAI
jgi:hypothetical protein